MMKENKVLVIIVSYNFERWLMPCLESLRRSECPVDVLVVDNHSADHTVQRVREEYPEVRIIENRENLGFGAANNIGLAVALRENYEAVFLLNQDAWISKQAIGALLSLSRKNPRYGILSPVHFNGRGDGLDFGFAGYSGVKSPSGLPVNLSFVPVGFINAAFWMIPVQALRAVGGFSPLFYHYGEDKDYVNRLRYHGYEVGYSPRVSGCHDRENRPVSPETALRSVQVYLLSEYANINYSFPKAFAYGVLAAVKKAIASLAKGKNEDAGVYFSMAAYLLARTRIVFRARKQTTRKGANYIPL